MLEELDLGIQLIKRWCVPYVCMYMSSNQLYPMGYTYRGDVCIMNGVCCKADNFKIICNIRWVHILKVEHRSPYFCYDPLMC